VAGNTQRSFADFSDYEYEWNSDIERRFFDNFGKIFRVVQENPSFMGEMQAIVDKYTKQTMTESDKVEEESES